MRPLAFRAATVDLRGSDEIVPDDLVFVVPRTFEEVDLLDDLREGLEELRDPPFCAARSNGRSRARTKPIRAKRFVIELFSLKRWMAFSVRLEFAATECSSVMTASAAKLFLHTSLSKILGDRHSASTRTGLALDFR